MLGRPQRNTEEIKEKARLENIIDDKEKIIKLQEEKIAYLNNLVSLKQVFKEIKVMQNEIKEKLCKKIKKEKR